MFTIRRWNQLVRIIEQIDDALEQVAAKQYIRFCYQIGGKAQVSVTTDYPCVDPRAFYQHPQYGPDRTTRRLHYVSRNGGRATLKGIRRGPIYCHNYTRNFRH